MWMRPARKRLLKEADYARLKQKLCGGSGTIRVSEQDLEILRGGEAAFLWESPITASAEEAVDMARQAAAEMAPGPGRVILALVLYVMMGLEVGLDAFEEIVGPIQQIISKDGAILLGTGACDEGGIRFLLAVCEGREETR